jgi:hypothetical protein
MAFDSGSQMARYIMCWLSRFGVGLSYRPLLLIVFASFADGRLHAEEVQLCSLAPPEFVRPAKARFTSDNILRNLRNSRLYREGLIARADEWRRKSAAYVNDVIASENHDRIALLRIAALSRRMGEVEELIRKQCSGTLSPQSLRDCLTSLQSAEESAIEMANSLVSGKMKTSSQSCGRTNADAPLMRHAAELRTRYMSDASAYRAKRIGYQRSVIGVGSKNGGQAAQLCASLEVATIRERNLAQSVLASGAPILELARLDDIAVRIATLNRAIELVHSQCNSGQFQAATSFRDQIGALSARGAISGGLASKTRLLAASRECRSIAVQQRPVELGQCAFKSVSIELAASLSTLNHAR